MISVVIPTRGRPATARVAVLSALNQTLQQLEVIVVIDGVDLATADVLSTIRDQRLRVISLPIPRGAPAARNAGVQAAIGEWIAFLDDDDEWLPDKLLRQMEAAAQSSVAQPVVCSAYWGRSDRGDVLFGRREPQTGEALSEYMFCRKSFVYGENALATSVLLMPKSLMVAVTFDERLRKHQDWDWALRALKEKDTKLVYVSQPLAIYNMASGAQRISANGDWDYSLEWCLARKAYITRKAIAYFLVTECLARAVRCGAGWGVKIKLLTAYFREGQPDARSLFMAAVLLLLPQGVRELLKKKKQHP